MGGIQQLWFRPRSSSFRLWMFNVHLYAGLGLGLLTSIIGLTGSIIVYKPEMERLEAGAMARVQPTATTVPLSKLYAFAQNAVPQKRIERLYIWGGNDAAWAFRTSDHPRNREYVYVDQFRGRVLGRAPMDGTWLQWIYDLHDDILLGKPGLVTNGVGALLLALLCVTGIVIWWPGARRIRDGFNYHWRAKWKGQIFDLHKLMGMAVMIVLAVIAITGASYAFPNAYRVLAGTLTHSRSSLPKPQSIAPKGSNPAPIDRVFQAAMDAIPGATLTVLTWPGDRKAAFVARERLAGDWSRLGDTYVYIDQYSGNVLRSDIANHLPLGNRIMLAMTPLHYGTFGGQFTRLLWIVMGLTPGILTVTGFLMWWNRVVARKLTIAKRARGACRTLDFQPIVGKTQNEIAEPK